MTRLTARARRKATAVQVPDLKDDAAERKRALNVLAQRRYRERKREHLKKLESQVESSASPSTETASETPCEIAQIRPTDLHANSPVTNDLLHPIELPLLGSAASGGVANGLEDPVSADDGWTNPFTSAVHAWPAATLLPSLFPSSNSSPSTTTPTSDQPTETSTSPSSLGGADWPSILGMDITSAMQIRSTRSYTFPDERYTDILELKLLRGCMMIAKRLNIDDLLWSLESTSPFTDPVLSGLSFDHLPTNLRPTATQQLIPHHPVLDLFAWPVVRDKLILVFSQPPEVRPPIAASPLALMDLVYDFENSAEGVRIWGDDPFNAENWEAGEALFKKWWWALDNSIIGKSNQLRKKRGAPLLGVGAGFVVGERAHIVHKMAAKAEFHGMAWLLSSGEFSDFDICCETQVLRVHCAILATNSEDFHKLLKSNMTHLGSITFPDEEAYIIARLLEFYTYTAKYLTDPDPDVVGFQRNTAVSEHGRKCEGIWTSNYDILELQVFLFAVADKYGVVIMQDFSRLGFLRADVAIFTRSAELSDAATRDDRETFGKAILDITRAICASRYCRSNYTEKHGAGRGLASISFREACLLTDH